MEVQLVESARKNLVFMVCLLYTQALTDASHFKLSRTPETCCEEGCSTCWQLVSPPSSPA